MQGSELRASKPPVQAPAGPSFATGLGLGAYVPPVAGRSPAEAVQGAAGSSAALQAVGAHQPQVAAAAAVTGVLDPGHVSGFASQDTKEQETIGMESHRQALKKAVESLQRTPALFRRRKNRAEEQSGAENVKTGAAEERRAPRVVVPCWKADPHYATYCKLKSEVNNTVQPAVVVPIIRKALESTIIRQSVHKVSRQKGGVGGSGAGRTYTSQYRGVHQTFPTRRWEAQFRRAGKPTSLGCFDEEEEAARAYDRMMIWCDLHNAEYRSLGLTRNGVTNFPPEEYTDALQQLAGMTQDELVQELRAVGRMQATQGAGGSAAKRLKGERPGSAARAAGRGGATSGGDSEQGNEHGLSGEQGQGDEEEGEEGGNAGERGRAQEGESGEQQQPGDSEGPFTRADPVSHDASREAAGGDPPAAAAAEALADADDAQAPLAPPQTQEGATASIQAEAATAAAAAASACEASHGASAQREAAAADEAAPMDEDAPAIPTTTSVTALGGGAAPVDELAQPPPAAVECAEGFAAQGMGDADAAAGDIFAGFGGAAQDT